MTDDQRTRLTPEQLARLAAAHAALDRGWNVIPLEPHGKRCLLKSWKCYQHKRVTHAQLDAWWRQWPDANIGVITGRISDLVVLDVDGDAGWASLQARPILPITAGSETARGLHFLFAYPAGAEVRNFAGRWPGLDLRAEGGYFVLPPSVHATGFVYAWRRTPEEFPLAPLPAWLLDAAASGDGDWGLGDSTSSATHPPAIAATNPQPLTPNPQHTNPQPLSPNPQAYLTKVLAHLAATPVGMRNDRLNRAAYALGRLVGGGQLDGATVAAALEQAAAGLGLPPVERQRTIASGLAAGQRCPRGGATEGTRYEVGGTRYEIRTAGNGGESPALTEAPGRRDDTATGEGHAVAADAGPPALPRISSLIPPTSPSPYPPLTLLDDLLAEEQKTIPWLVEGLLPLGGTALTAGRPKLGKTTLLRMLALCTAGGWPWLDRAVRQGPVVYLALEETRAGVADHFRRMGATGLPIHVHTGRAPDDPLGWLEDLVARYQPVLVIIDPLFKFVRLPDVNDYASISRALEALSDLATRRGPHIHAVHHTNKSERDWGDDVLGSSAITGGLDTTLTLRRRGSERVLMGIRRYGGDLAPLALAFDPATGRVTVGTPEAPPAEAPPPRAEDELPERIKAALVEGPRTEAELRLRLGGNINMVSRVLRAMVADGQIVRTGAGLRNNPYYYALPQPDSD